MNINHLEDCGVCHSAPCRCPKPQRLSMSERVVPSVELDKLTVLKCAEEIHNHMRLYDAYSKRPHWSEAPGAKERWDDRWLTAWELKDRVLRLIGKRAPVNGEDQDLLTSEKEP